MSVPLLSVQDLSVVYPGSPPVRAVEGCSLAIGRGEIFALVGESGSGKSTVARAVAGLVRPAQGQILLDGVPLEGLRGAAAKTARRRIQMVFQDPDASLNPYHRIGTSLAEPLRVRGIKDKAAIEARVSELLAMVRIDRALLDRRPRELSGGQKQRVAIARALAMEPELLIADEALSALDVSTQAAVGALLRELRDRLSLSILFISHDLLMVRHLADRVAIMRGGQILEQGVCGAVLDAPAHRYTRLLLDATPDLARGGIDLDAEEALLDTEGDVA
ncbi:ABC transporter ATP-binding protein [Polymorphobacter sp.]|uniref:ABC transporter ATP-binding protein n=1 Tax=Polymorphobacter sp. TaxID=1909290 RepID=UPI003F717643